MALGIACRSIEEVNILKIIRGNRYYTQVFSKINLWNLWLHPEEFSKKRFVIISG